MEPASGAASKVLEGDEKTGNGISSRSSSSSSSSDPSSPSTSSSTSSSSSSSSSVKIKKKKPRHRHRNARSFRQLRLAIARNDAKRARQLLQRGATTPNAGFWNGKIESTLLMEAALGKKERLTELLLVYGADPNAKTKIKAKTPLHYAATGGGVRVMQMLVAYGADMRARDAHGWTVLHFAAYWNRLDAIQYALFLKVDPKAQDKDGKNAQDWAKINGASEAEAYLGEFMRRGF